MNELRFSINPQPLLRSAAELIPGTLIRLPQRTDYASTNAWLDAHREAWDAVMRVLEQSGVRWASDHVATAIYYKESLLNLDWYKESVRVRCGELLNAEPVRTYAWQELA